MMKNKKMPPLGRWDHRLSEKQKDMKIIWANADHCGDHICGKPSDISNNIKYYTENTSSTQD
tara:strand:- start:6793 stop:6978 length:186 start_codon:yes stop_codon:yes gene_type:complete